MLPRLMAHGGAWDWDDALDAGKRDGLAEAIAIGYRILSNGGTALDAVEQTVISLENNVVFDAGTGGYLNRDGVVQLDALIVDGAKRDFGAVAAVTTIKNPIVLARKILTQTDQCFFVGEGGNQIAVDLGMRPIENKRLVTPAMRQFFDEHRTDGPSDTVGAIAIDGNGDTAAATSTSGTPLKPSGRVGDSPLYGAGGYAANNIGVAGATGHGESIMRLLMSKCVCDAMAGGMSAADATFAATENFTSVIGESMSGVIAIDNAGNPGAAQTAPKMAFGWVDVDGNVRTAVRAADLQ